MYFSDSERTMSYNSCALGSKLNSILLKDSLFMDEEIKW